MSPGPVSAHLVEELAPQVGVFVVETPPERRHRARAFLLDAAHLRAQMNRLELYRDAARLHEVDEPVGDFLAEPFLHREPSRVEPDEPGQLGDAEDLVAGDIRQMCDTMERQRMVLAEGEERDRPLDDLTVPAVDVARSLGRESSAQLGVPGVSRSMPNAAKISPM
jgi:hypothetical protein